MSAPNCSKRVHARETTSSSAPLVVQPANQLILASPLRRLHSPAPAPQRQVRVSDFRGQLTQTASTSASIKHPCEFAHSAGPVLARQMAVRTAILLCGNH